MKLFNIVSWLSSYIDQLHSKLHTSLLRMGGGQKLEKRVWSMQRAISLISATIILVA